MTDRAVYAERRAEAEGALARALHAVQGGELESWRGRAPAILDRIVSVEGDWDALADFLVSDPPEPEPTMWRPEVGDLVWLNYPDSPRPEGRVVGFVPEGGEVPGYAPMPNRVGQPIIERVEDAPDTGGMFKSLGWRKGERVVLHLMFLLPFPYGGPEWREANAAGRVG